MLHFNNHPTAVRRNKPILVRDLLTLFVKEFNLEKGFREYRFLKLWDEITGPAVAKATTARKLNGTKLYVYLSSSVVRSELYMLRSDLVREMNSRMGEKVIDEIRLM
jgi:predicted nucleic acid-binding Zn ribbon protein